MLKPIWLMQPIPYMGEEIQGSWIWEPKIDGWRLQIIKIGRRAEFWGRRLEKNPNWTSKLCYLEKFLEDIPPETLLDCELYSEKGRRFIPSLFKAKPDVKPIIYVFDVVYIGGEEVAKKPLKERKKILNSLHIVDPFIIMPFQFFNDEVRRILLKAKRQGHEGIVLKDMDSPYEIGKDGPIATIYWRKVK